jgi:di/tricarboxylate transporter
MDMHQLLAIGVIAAMMLAFIWGRFRYDLVACAALLVALAVGVVKPEEAFTGFADDIVIIVGSALVVSGAVAKSGVMEAALQRLAPNVTAPRMQLLLLVGVVTVLSAFVKNIGALAIMIPIAFQMARRSGVSPSMFLMPMSFGSLLGGLMTLIGTSPNIIVSRVRAELTGTPFRMFDFTPVALPLAIAGVTFLVFFYWLLPARKREDLSLDEAIEIDNYTTEARVTKDSGIAEKTVADLHKLAGGDAMVTAILRSGGRRTPLPDATLRPGDILLLEGGQEALDKLVAQGGLELASRQADADTPAEEIGTVEAIVGQNSSLIGLSARQMTLFHRTGLNLLAVSRRGKRFTERLGQIRLEAGDVIVLQGNLKRLPDMLRELDCLPLADRQVRLGSVRNGIVPVAILLVAMGATALGLVPVAVAFFAAAVAMVLFGAVTPREV